MSSNPAVTLGMASLRHAPKTDTFQYGPWTFTSVKSHILTSEGPERERIENILQLPQLPEMLFADNVLMIQHSSGCGIEFNPIHALKLVDNTHDLMQVAVATQWKEARAGCEHINDVVKPFDWTYTQNYLGTLLGNENAQLTATETDERIDIEKLKVKEKILFYSDLRLFEDELADHGCAILNAKVRVMPSGFFILLRFYLRVDNAIIRIHDTRIHHEFDKSYILREFSRRESKYSELMVPAPLYTDPNEIASYLTLKEEKCERLELKTINQIGNMEMR